LWLDLNVALMHKVSFLGYNSTPLSSNYNPSAYVDDHSPNVTM